MRSYLRQLSLPLLLLAVSLPAIVQFGQDWFQPLLQLQVGQSPSTPASIHFAMLAGLLALVGRIRRLLWLLLPAAFLSVPETFYLLSFGQPSDPHLYGVIADTNFEEVRSWIGPWLVPGALVMCAWGVAVGWMGRVWWREDWRWAHRSRLWVLLACTGLGGGVVALHQSTPPIVTWLVEGMDDPYIEYSVNAPRVGILATLEHIYPWGIPLRWANFREHQRALASHAQGVASFKFDVRWTGEPPAGRQVQVLVIGETGRPDRWGLFGADRDTTPRLTKRSGLTPFFDAVSGAAATREAVPLMLTRRPVRAELAPSREPSLITAFRQAGYRTYWLSTQGTAGRHETPISVLADEADEKHFVNAVSYLQAGALDGKLLPLVQRILARSEPRQLIVLHTLGSHLSYAHRYPREFERFQPALQPDEAPDIWTPSVHTRLLNAYDNSVLYTDYVIDETIDMLSKTQAAATLMYAADHGETLFDGSCDRGGHGFAAETNYRIPMLVWTSTAWRNGRPEALAALQAHAHAPVTALSVFETMTGLAGFETAQPSAHGDLSSVRWRPSSRPITHYGDFDRDIKGKSCSSR